MGRHSERRGGLDHTPPSNHIGVMAQVLLFAMNVAVIAILGALAYFLNWSGPGFAAGILVGGISMAWVVRLKIGYWP